MGKLARVVIIVDAFVLLGSGSGADRELDSIVAKKAGAVTQFLLDCGSCDSQKELDVGGLLFDTIVYLAARPSASAPLSSIQMRVSRV
jgi:hypothetical protein